MDSETTLVLIFTDEQGNVNLQFLNVDHFGDSYWKWSSDLVGANITVEQRLENGHTIRIGSMGTCRNEQRAILTTSLVLTNCCRILGFVLPVHCC